VLMNKRPEGPCILIGEDEPEVRQYLETTLKCLGYRVEVAENGNEVLKCLEASDSDISLVLLDISCLSGTGWRHCATSGERTLRYL